MGNGHLIVFANEKGGSGKSTTSVHVAVALSVAGKKVATVDMDTRQRTLGRYLENRAATVRRTGRELPLPYSETFDPAVDPDAGALIERLLSEYEIVVVDTPGRDDVYTRAAIERADTLVTPINDSFIDLDLIGQVDPDTFKIRKPSFYAEVVWDARKARARADGGTVDWVVLRNRLQHLEARNMRRVAEAMGDLAKRVGFRVIPGLSERVIYRELFPKGLTLLDMGALGSEAGLAHIAARQELREMIAGLALSQWPQHQKADSAPPQQAVPR